MAVKVTKKPGAAKSGLSVADVLEKQKKDKGDSIGNFGGNPMPVDRLPTGLFPLDLATGGGLPRCRATMIYGPESSNKTNIALGAIRQNQLLHPEQTNVFVAIEPFDKVWAEKMGVDTSKLVVVVPSYAEQAVDMVEQFLLADDCGVVVLDSIAAMITTAESEKSAEGVIVGGTGLVVGKLVRRTTMALNEAEKAGRSPVLIYINQIRFKIGVLFGNPETTPGGEAPKFQAALRIRVYGKNVIDSKISEVPIKKDVNFIINKAKCPIIAASGHFEMVTFPHKSFKVGETDDFNTITEYLKNFGVLAKHKKGWEILGEIYPKLEAFEDRLYGDKAFGADIRHSIINKVLEDQEGITIDPDKKITPDGEVIEDESEETVE